MPSKSFLSAIREDLPVLFACIGWAIHYDGTEPVIGGHGYLKKHPYDNSEARAFTMADDGFFYCGIGRGGMPPRVHVVFLALDPERQAKRIVGVYAAAGVELEKIEIPKRNKAGRRKHIPWAEAYTRYAVWIPRDRRPEIPAWPAGQGQRRWASIPSGQLYLILREFFEDLKAKLPALLEKPPQDEG